MHLPPNSLVQVQVMDKLAEQWTSLSTSFCVSLYSQRTLADYTVCQ